MAQSGVGSPGYNKSPLQTMKPATIVKQETTSRVSPNKRKDYHNQLRESSEFERASWEHITSIQTHENTERQDMKDSKRQKLAIEVEDIISRNMQEENSEMPQHELTMMDRKLKLARLQQGPPHQYGQADFSRSQSTNYRESQLQPFSNSPLYPYHGFPFDNTFTGKLSNTSYDTYSTDSVDTPTASSTAS